MQHNTIWLDGTLVPSHNATIPITTHTLHYGTGAFEGIRCYRTKNGPALFRLDEHIERLLASFNTFNVPAPFTKKELAHAIINTVNANNLSDCYVRPLLYFGEQSLMLSPKKLSVHCAIITMSMDAYKSPNPITVGISSIMRVPPRSMPLERKINGFYVNSVLAFHDIQERGFDEALLLDDNNNVAEGSVANIFFVIDNALVTPPAGAILPGITRDSIITIARSRNIPVHETHLTPNDIREASEAFFCGTAREITPIKQIENTHFSTHPMSSSLAHAFHAITRGNDARFAHWLTSTHKDLS